MHVESSQQRQDAVTPEDAREMLDRVHRDLVQIHAAMAERTSGDREIKSWAQRELMDVIRQIGAFRRTRQEAASNG